MKVPTPENRLTDDIAAADLSAAQKRALLACAGTDHSPEGCEAIEDEADKALRLLPADMRARIKLEGKYRNGRGNAYACRLAANILAKLKK